MEIPIYLALTATEFCSCTSMPPHTAWLSCLFSPYGRGLSNIPKQLPPNSLLILSDRTPICNHDPELIKDTLSQVLTAFSCSGLLLDFERTDNPEAGTIAKILTTLPYQVAVSAPYANELDCPVFVPSPPPSQSLDDWLIPWNGREIWIEAGAQAQSITVTESGTTFKNVMPPLQHPHRDADLCCHYTIEQEERSITFTLQRLRQDWIDLLSANNAHKITRAIGLYQELA